MLQKNYRTGTSDPKFELAVFGNNRATGAVFYGNPAAMYTRPDFVFEVYYPILEPEEIEEFIHKENHLPWVTSAQEDRNENGDVVNMTRMAFETPEATENIQLPATSRDLQNRTIPFPF